MDVEDASENSLICLLTTVHYILQKYERRRKLGSHWLLTLMLNLKISMLNKKLNLTECSKLIILLSLKNVLEIFLACSRVG